MLARVSFRRIRIALFVLATFGVVAVHPTWARSIGADVWSMPALREEMRASQSEGDRLTADSDEIHQRLVVKEAIVADLIVGRITLVEAVEQFVVLNASRPEYMISIRSASPGTSDYEKNARNVITYTLLRVPPHERNAVAGRLEAELGRALHGSAH